MTRLPSSPPTPEPDPAQSRPPKSRWVPLVFWISVAALVILAYVRVSSRSSPDPTNPSVGQPSPTNTPWYKRVQFESS